MSCALTHEIHKLCRYATFDERKERYVATNFSDQVLRCLRMRSRDVNRIVQRTAGNLERSILFVHTCGISIMFLKNPEFAIGLVQLP